MSKVTISDVAKEANVSKSTVSQFLNNRFEYMSEETRQKIAQTIERLNYRPNVLARSLKQKSTKTMGVVVANIVHSFSTQIINQLEISLHTHGYHMIVCNAGDDPVKEREHIEVLIAKQVDGIIAFPTGGNVDLFTKLYETNYPIVFIDRKIDNLSIPSVLLDNELASSLAVDAFVSRGYQRMAIITNVIDQLITPRIERLNGFKKAMEKHHLPVTDSMLKAVPLDEVSGVMDQLMVEVRPQAIIAGNDRILIEVLNYAKNKNLKIPEELAVIGIDEVPFASFFEPTISTIEQPAQQIASKASEILVKQIAKEYDRNEKATYRFKPVLNKRDSY